MLSTELGDLILSRLEGADDGGIALTLLNPEDDAIDAVIGAGLAKPVRAWRTSLAGDKLEDVPCKDGTVRLTVAPRAWTRVTIDVG